MTSSEPASSPTFALRHAYTSRDTATFSGGDHIIVATGVLKAGRLRREPGDALCKPARKFLALMQGDDIHPRSLQAKHTCKSCLKKAARLGIDDLSKLSHDTRIECPVEEAIQRDDDASTVPTPTKIVCERCGGSNIEQQWWVNPNTKELIDAVGGDEAANAQTWCHDCDDHVELVETQSAPAVDLRIREEPKPTRRLAGCINDYDHEQERGWLVLAADDARVLELRMGPWETASLAEARFKQACARAPEKVLADGCLSPKGIHDGL